MPINIFGPNQFVVQHNLVFPLGGNSFLISLSGVALVDLTGQQGPDWHRDVADMFVPLADALNKTGRTPSPNHHLEFVVRQGVPIVTPNSFTDLNQAVNFGVEVDSFEIDDRQGAPDGNIHVRFDIGARDVDTFLHRISYLLIVIGDIAEVPTSI